MNYFTEKEIDQVIRYDRKNGKHLFNEIYEFARLAPHGTFSMPNIKVMAMYNGTTRIRRKNMNRIMKILGYKRKKKNKKKKKKEIL